jgi:hypothetical protein
MKRTAILALALALAGCVGARNEMRGPEFAGRTVRVQAANGQVTLLRFQPDGDVVARFGERETRGGWNFGDGRLCFTWAGNYRECWPHVRPFRTGRTETVTSDRGNVVQVTLLK